MSDISVKKNQEVAASYALEAEKVAQMPKVAVLPDIAQKILSEFKAPALERPKGDLPISTISNLSEEALMIMLGAEERKDAVKSGLASLKADAEKRKEINEQKIEKLQEQAEKARESMKMHKIQKAFNILGSIISGLLSIVSIVGGIFTCNPAMVVSGVCGVIGAVDGIVSEATDGKHSIARAIADDMISRGVDKETAEKTGMGVTMGIAGIGLIAGIASGFSSAAASTVVKSITNLALNAGTITSNVVQVGVGSVKIATAVKDSELENIKADGKELEAILMRLMASTKMDTEMLQAILERTQAQSDGVKQCIEENRKAINSILTQRPAMA